MGSVMDWLASFSGPERNPYLRLNERARLTLGARALLCFLSSAALFALWRWLA